MQPLRAPTPDSTDEPRYTELLRVPAMSVGTYSVPAGAVDPQQPHSEDEVYVIVQGAGVLRTQHGDEPAYPGAALFVPRGEQHAFVNITQDLLMYVIFAPAERSLRQETAR